MTDVIFEERKTKINDLMRDVRYVPMREKDLACMMQVSPEDRPDFKKALEELLAEGRIQINKRGRYSIAQEQLLTGTFISHPKGFGFVQVEGEEAGKEDLYIPEQYVNGAWHSDLVEVRPVEGASTFQNGSFKGRRQEAQVVRIIARGMTQIVGTYQQRTNFGFVIPDNNRVTSDIFVPKERSKGAVEGSKVVAQITDYGRPGRNPEGKIIEILGHIYDPGVDILSIVRSYGLPEAFPEKAVNQAVRVAAPVSEADCEGRLDLRNVPMVTIDGEDARDLDDAVSLQMEGGMYRLGVHIADVANYVQENSALDREALNRGTSVYLVDRVIPMLPHTLSNGICSLNAGEDRLALSCIMTIDPKGNVIDYRLAETVIRVERRMTYTSVAGILKYTKKINGTDIDITSEDLCSMEKDIKQYESVVPMLCQMEELSGILREKRHRRGAIDFDFPESKIILDKDGHPTQIRPYERNAATMLIEDFMLLANETVAQHFYWLQVPFVYRTHDNPDPDKIRQLGMFIHNFGYSIHAGQEEIHPKELQKLLKKIEGTPEEALISRLTLRSMKQAKYTTECAGHFGLASQYYCHFTSPIRRYPDLQIHRIIKEQLRGRLTEDRITHYEQILPQAALLSSRMERRAEEAERETVKLKKVEFMESHVGEVYDGVISGITAWGLYVELTNTVEGLVHVSMLPGDYFYYDEGANEMKGRDTQVSYKLGEKIKVEVKFADRFSRTIDFVLPQEN